MRIRVGIAGGGIAGLYTAWTFAQPPYEADVTLYETRAVFGGRIETVDLAGYLAEFGPMRFEPGIQPLISNLVEHLDLRFERFTPPGSSPASDPRTRGYKFRPDECPRGDDSLITTLDMLRFGVIRMFTSSIIPTEFRQLTKNIDLSQDPRIQGWLDRLSDDDQPTYNWLRSSAKLGDRPLRDLGIWNALSEVLSPDAVRFIREEGTCGCRKGHPR